MRKIEGFALLQVMVVLGLGLALMAFLFPIASQSTKAANSSASQSRLHSLVQKAKFALAETDNCKNLLIPKAGYSIANGGEALIWDPNKTPLFSVFLVEGTAYDGVNFNSYPDLKITSVKILPLVPTGTSFTRNADLENETPPAPPTATVGTEARYLLNVMVTGQRVTGGTGANFLGAANITEQFPIIVQSNDGVTFQFCSSKSSYQIPIGPVNTSYKSALDCIDRDGVPTQVVNGTNTYFVCGIPASPGTQQAMFPLDCQPAPPGQNDSPLYHEGWQRDAIQPPGLPASGPPTAAGTMVNCI